MSKSKASAPPTILKDAADLARGRWHVLPAHAVDDGECSCPAGAGCARPGAHPSVPEGIEAATTNLGRINRWWRDGKAVGIGVATGERCGRIGVRIASAQDREGLKQAHGQLPRTPTVQNGEEHVLFFRCDRAIPSLRQLGGLSLDVIGDGDLVVVPPSPPGSAVALQWLVSPSHAALADAPTWLTGLIVEESMTDAAGDDEALVEDAPTAAGNDSRQEESSSAVGDVNAQPEDVPTAAGCDGASSTEASVCAEPPTPSVNTPATPAPREYAYHPIANLFPLLEGEDCQKFKDDIRKNGLREPIVLHQGKILDGRNRYRACIDLGIEVVTSEWDAVGDPLTFVFSKNLHRRHLNSSQRAAIAVEVEALLSQDAKRRQRRHAGTAPGRSGSLPEKNPEVNGEARGGAALLTGTNAHYVSDAKRIKLERPELFEKVKAGELRITAALQLLTSGSAAKDDVLLDGGITADSDDVSDDVTNDPGDVIDDHVTDSDVTVDADDVSDEEGVIAPASPRKKKREVHLARRAAAITEFKAAIRTIDEQSTKLQRAAKDGFGPNRDWKHKITRNDLMQLYNRLNRAVEAQQQVLAQWPQAGNSPRAQADDNQ